ncbi:HIRA-interacting protein 3 isoform X2 [Rousettus aegyptiacus]|uniref:HIRA-interacting protein 3 isoform X2 n=1 Tax=Rousettus aegyptiacus TaxID=9407 RepID=UPI00168D6CE5|nr:HIRA-interacting protein 3 isoform X2 [Rousettus aegyptiacus]
MLPGPQHAHALHRAAALLGLRGPRPPRTRGEAGAEAACGGAAAEDAELSSAASSPDCFSPQAKNGMVAAVSPVAESPKPASKNAIESSHEEEQQRDLAAKIVLEEVVKESSKEEGTAKTSKVCKEESSEEEEDGEKEEKEVEMEFKGRTKRKPVTKNKQVPCLTSASRKQAAVESEDSEEDPAQKMRNKGATRYQESEKESKEETLAKKKKNREEEEEDRKPRARSKRGKKSAWEERISEQKSKVRLLGDCRDRKEEEKAAADSGDNSGDEESLVQKNSKDRTQWKGGKRQSGSSEEDGEDSWRKLKLAFKDTGKTGQVESGKIANGEASDSEREVSDSEAGGSLKGERKNRSYRRSSKKNRTRSSSSSSANGSPELKGRKVSSGRRGEDHPAVMRLKRYIRACGAHRNYKKLLGSCRSHKERLTILRAELESLGMKGNPSLEKCRALKEQREEAAEMASLDITNIISASGRPRRCTAWNPSETATPGELYRRTLDSEEERSRPPPPDWSHMRGIISSDGESN